MTKRINKFYNKKIRPCKRCGSQGVLTQGIKKWHILCLGHCTNSTNYHLTRFGALLEWNVFGK